MSLHISTHSNYTIDRSSIETTVHEQVFVLYEQTDSEIIIRAEDTDREYLLDLLQTMEKNPLILAA